MARGHHWPLTHNHGLATGLFCWFSLASLALLTACIGCNSFGNGWLDPTVLGDFDRVAMMEIRTSLTLEDTPRGLPGATPPKTEDHELVITEYPISAGDALDIEIFELRQRGLPYRNQAVTVSSSGYVNLPAVQRVRAAGLTILEFQQALVDELRDQEILQNPEVTVNPIFLQKATYSIFGIGVSAANNAPLRAGTFPIRTPELHILDAVNQVGGLNEFATELYVFRYDERYDAQAALLDATIAEDTSKSAAKDQQAAPPSDSHHTHESTMPTGNGESHEDEPTAEDQASQAAPSPPSPTSNHEPGESGELMESVLTSRRELIEAVLDPDQHQDHMVDQAKQAVREAVEGDPADPFLMIDGNWIPNPSFEASPDSNIAAAIPTQLDTITPAVNWARIAGESSFRIIEVRADRLRDGDPQANIYIRAGDVIRIVSGEIGVYYVMGQVNRVGPFAFNAERITLKAAIAAAGGLSVLAWPSRCTVYRTVGNREQMIQVDLDRIFAGKDPDFEIRRGDIVNVGTHPFAPFLQRARALTLPNIASNVGYSFTYARNFADIDSFAVQQNPANAPSRFPALFP